ncbi:MAG: radical SAM family heme chaperone HemW [Pseudomonadales bacterium]|nr:radical SAM family heme chaperone HemW [Pseudomonadales bacterium]
MLERPPLSLYIHIPWCVRKCPYCDFNSHESESPLPEAQYIDALLEDFSQEFGRLDTDQIELQSIFIGGGTPSLFGGASYKKLLQRINESLAFATDIEVTLEANPGTAEAGRFTDFREAGINRLSLGIQSFDDARLQQLGRIHNADEALKAIELAKNAGFANFNLDLMHGLPDQTAKDALNDLQIAMECNPSHVSWYQLTIEPNTVFYRRPPELPHENILEEIQISGQKLLESQDYHQYEVSAYAKPGNKSLHNQNYWSFGDYMGIGAGAHGKITLPDESKILRTRKIKQPNHYLTALNGRNGELKEILTQERPLEFLMNALRLRRGFSKKQFESRTGLPFGEIAKRVESQVENGLMQMEEVDDELLISTTATGYRFLNSVLEEFL